MEVTTAARQTDKKGTAMSALCDGGGGVSVIYMIS